MTIFFDRSRIVQDWRCPRSRYWAYEYKGIGISPLARPLYFDFGTAIHECLASILIGMDVDAAIADARELLITALQEADDHFREEQTCLLEGIVRGWVRWGLAALLAEYEVVGVEVETILTLAPGVVMACKPDLLLRRLSDDTYWYVEWKTTGSLGDQWFPQWNRAIQLQAGALAVKETKGIEIDGVIVQGLYKGYKREGVSTSIFTYGYQRALQAVYKWAPGSVKVPVWQLPGGCKQWVESMPTEILESQFAQTPPIFLKMPMIKRWMAQTLFREQTIDAANFSLEAGLDPEGTLDKVFPQHFDQCEPQMGSPCPFTGLCFNPVAADDPLHHGFRWRDPHHEGDPAFIRLREIS